MSIPTIHQCYPTQNDIGAANAATGEGYKPELDGLRALAISLVALDHFFNSAFPGGFVGVDLFFVLSGYLISSILLTNLQQSNRINLPQFYFRRFLRLTPALLALLSVYFAGTVAYLLWSHKVEFGQVHFWAVSAAATYLMNWNLAVDVGPPGFLIHTWSLGIEAQFYLMWPLLLIFAARWLDRTKLAFLCVALILLCNGWRAYLWLHELQGPRNYSPVGHRIYMGFDTRVDSLLIGCLLALVPVQPRWRETIAKLVLIPLVVMLLFLFFVEWDSTIYLLGASLIAMCAAWIVSAVLTDRGSLLAHISRLRPVVYFGRISYSYYLWHLPIWLVLGWFMAESVFGRAALAAALSLAAASSSYHLIEIPFRRFRRIAIYPKGTDCKAEDCLKPTLG